MNLGYEVVVLVGKKLTGVELVEDVDIVEVNVDVEVAYFDTGICCCCWCCC